MHFINSISQILVCSDRKIHMTDLLYVSLWEKLMEWLWVTFMYLHVHTVNPLLFHFLFGRAVCLLPSSVEVEELWWWFFSHWLQIICDSCDRLPWQLFHTNNPIAIATCVWIEIETVLCKPVDSARLASCKLNKWTPETAPNLISDVFWLCVLENGACESTGTEPQTAVGNKYQINKLKDTKKNTFHTTDGIV